MVLPLIRQSQLYSGQFGVHGSDVPRGLRWAPRALTLFVDPDSPDNTDAGDGVNPEQPLSTIQGAVDRLIAHQAALGSSLAGSTIVCAGAAYTESVIVPAPVAAEDTVPYVRLLGVGGHSHQPTWAGVAGGAAPCLTIRAEGWTVEGFEFNCPNTSSGVRVEEVPGSTISAYKTTIQNCVFDGLWAGQYGVEFYGAPHRVSILNNWFLEMDSFCIYVTDSTHTNPYQCAIVGNRFSDSQNYIGNLGSIRGFNVSLFKDNIFEEGTILIPTTYLDLRGGSIGYNIVTNNFFGGAYTNAGGYYANAATPDANWVGNTAEPTPAQVADNGVTIAVPA